MLPSLGTELDLGVGAVSGLAHCKMKSPALQNECVNPFLTQQTPQGGPLISRWQIYGWQCTSLCPGRHYKQSQHFCTEPGGSPEPQSSFCSQNQPTRVDTQVPELRKRQMARHVDHQQSCNSRNNCFHTIFHCCQHITALPCFGSPNLSYPNLPMLISVFKREKQELDSKS